MSTEFNTHFRSQVPHWESNEFYEIWYCLDHWRHDLKLEVSGKSHAFQLKFAGSLNKTVEGSDLSARYTYTIIRDNPNDNVLTCDRVETLYLKCLTEDRMFVEITATRKTWNIWDKDNNTTEEKRIESKVTERKPEKFTSGYV